MSHLFLFSAAARRRPFIPQLFSVLACLALAVGSVILSIVWLGDGHVNLLGFLVNGTGLAAKMIATIFFSLPILGVVGLLNVLALLFARRWVMAVLVVPVTVLLYVVMYLCTVFLMPRAPALLFVVLLLLLNGGMLWFARWFLAHTFR